CPPTRTPPAASTSSSNSTTSARPSSVSSSLMAPRRRIDERRDRRARRADRRRRGGERRRGRPGHGAPAPARAPPHRTQLRLPPVQGAFAPPPHPPSDGAAPRDQLRHLHPLPRPQRRRVQGPPRRHPDQRHELLPRPRGVEPGAGDGAAPADRRGGLEPKPPHLERRLLLGRGAV